ncbi:hypothetical protein, partial [Salmonella sp. s54836]|uniref:hypothetical protein n=1 Tax=Salmonella sp. s54836 TaxID=3159673 RepID=UPI003980CC46
DVEGNGGKYLFKKENGVAKEYFIETENSKDVRCESITPRKQILEPSFRWVDCAFEGSFIESNEKIWFYELDLMGERFLLRVNEAKTIPLDFLHESRRGYSFLGIESFGALDKEQKFEVPEICPK